MPLFELNKQFIFPSPNLATKSGLLAIGGGLEPERILKAYQMGIFPWFNPGEVPQWWSPDPRFVLFPTSLKISKSMKQVLRKKQFKVTFDQDFLGVIKGCQKIFRPGQFGTWISNEIVGAYNILHQMGFVHSVEVWENEKLVGGLYGGVLGKCFFGESMFSKVSNASKVGFITLVKNLMAQQFELIDCQIHSAHLESLGAEMLDRKYFLTYVENNQNQPIKKENWNQIFKSDFEKW